MPVIKVTVGGEINLEHHKNEFARNYLKHPVIEFKTFHEETYRRTRIDMSKIETFSNNSITEKDFPKPYHESKKWVEYLKQRIAELERSTREKYERLLDVLTLLKKEISIECLKINVIKDSLVLTSGLSSLCFKDVLVNKDNKPSFIVYNDYKLLDLDDTYQILINLYVDFYKNLITERNKIKEEK